MAEDWQHVKYSRDNFWDEVSSNSDVSRCNTLLGLSSENRSCSNKALSISIMRGIPQVLQSASLSILDCIEAGNTFLHLEKDFEVVKIVEINLNLIYRFKFNLYINCLQLPYY